MLSFLAHAGETHASNNESLMHYLGVWYIAIAVFIIGTYLIGSVVYSLTKKSMVRTTVALLICYLAVGMTTYEKSPVLSALCIISGFMLAGIATLASLSVPQKK